MMIFAGLLLFPVLMTAVAVVADAVSPDDAPLPLTVLALVPTHI